MQKPKFRILSIDGGGIKGVIPCTILKYIETQTGRKISDTFDLIAGTSTGGIIALGLTVPDKDGTNKYSSDAMLDLYRINGKKIFAKRDKDLLTKITSLNKKIGELTQNPYEIENMEKLLGEYFGETHLREALSDLLVTTYDIESGRPFYFSSRLARNDVKEDFAMSRIARSTSAAPTYFEPSVTKYISANDVAFVDGGVFANNPSILAYAEAKELWKIKSAAEKTFDPVVTTDDSDVPFFMLSLGTGFHPASIAAAEAKNWRTYEWIEPLLKNIFMNSVAESTHYTMQHLLPPYTDNSERYRRLDFEIPEENAAMDDASEKNIDALCSHADKFVRANEKFLLQICEILS